MSTPQHLWVLDVSALAITARKVSSYYGGIKIHKSVKFGDVAVYHFVVTFGDFLTWYGTSCNAFVPCGTNFTNVFNWPNNPSQGCSQKLCWTGQNFNHFFSTIVVEGTVHYVREYPLNWLRAEITALGCASGPLFHPSANSSGILYYIIRVKAPCWPTPNRVKWSLPTPNNLRQSDSQNMKRHQSKRKEAN